MKRTDGEFLESVSGMLYARNECKEGGSKHTDFEHVTKANILRQLKQRYGEKGESLRNVSWAKMEVWWDENPDKRTQTWIRTACGVHSSTAARFIAKKLGL